jgi:hypothetical protein
MSTTSLPPIDWTHASRVSSHQRMEALELLPALLEAGNLNPVIPIEGGPIVIEFARWQGQLFAYREFFEDQADNRGNTYKLDAPIPYGETIRLSLQQEFDSYPEIDPQVYAVIHSFTPADHALLLTAMMGRREERRPGPLGDRLLGPVGYFPESIGWDDLSERAAEGNDPDFDRRHSVRNICIDCTDTRSDWKLRATMSFEDLRPGLLKLLRQE